jgi:uridine kinase
MHPRKALLEQLAHKIAALKERAIVAVDGVDGSGKTRFADELAPLIENAGRPVVRAGVDGFHNPRAVRYRRGKSDPEGFFRDSYNYDSLRRHLLDPFRQGAAWVDVARFDHRTDREIVSARRAAEPSAILLLDGIFLHRDELHGLWDYSIFLAVPFTVSYARMAERDGSDPDPPAPENRRYYEGQNIYFRACQPQKRATVVIDNSRLEAPCFVNAS